MNTESAARRIPFLRRLYFGIVLQGNQIWLSEFLSYAMVLLLLLGLFAVTGTIMFNSIRIGTLDRAIVDMRREKVILAHEIKESRDRQRLVASVRAVSSGRISDSVMTHLVGLVYKSSRQYGYDPLLVLAVINVEGVFNPRAVGRFRSGAQSGALGLMQLKFSTAKEVADDLGIPLTSESDLFRPEINIPLGIAYLTRLITQFKSFKLGLMAYNLGPAAVYQALSDKSGLPIDYYNKVLRGYFRFIKLADQG